MATATHTIETLRAENEALFPNCVIRPERVASVVWYVTQIIKNKARYSGFGTIPWWFVGLLHAMEATFDFETHLHNGDSLRRRTVQEPVGRPPYGSGPYSWEESAKDALGQKGLFSVEKWDLATALFHLERYNGFGYRDYHSPCASPYLWSFSYFYVWGKYIADGKFSATAVSQQCGAAVILRRMADTGVITLV